MKRIRPLVLAGALSFGLGVAVPSMVSAQVADPVATEDRDTDWGWIGLLGLAGLAGLARRSHAEHPMARPNPATR